MNTMPNIRRIAPVLIILAAFLIGCAPQQHVIVLVDAISAKELPHRTTFAIVSQDKAIPPTDLQFREFAACVSAALRSKGLVPASSPSRADLLVSLLYGMVGPRDANDPAAAYQPQMGCRTYLHAPSLFTRYIGLDAADAASGTSLWHTAAVSTGTSADLRRIFPIMLAAMTPWIADNTYRQLNISIAESDPRVVRLKKTARTL